MAGHSIAGQPMAGAAAETSLLYLEGQDWRQQKREQKIDLAADFMRIFCVDPTMSASGLAACLDERLTDGPAFEQAIACASVLAGH